MKIPPPAYDDWKTFRDETGKWLAYVVAVGGAAWTAWKAIPTVAPYFFAAIPLLILVWVLRRARKSKGLFADRFMAPLCVTSLLIVVPATIVSATFFVVGQAVFPAAPLIAFFICGTLASALIGILFSLWLAHCLEWTYDHTFVLSAATHRLIDRIPVDQRGDLFGEVQKYLGESLEKEPVDD